MGGGGWGGGGELGHKTCEVDQWGKVRWYTAVEVCVSMRLNGCIVATGRALVKPIQTDGDSYAIERHVIMAIRTQCVEIET